MALHMLLIGEKSFCGYSKENREKREMEDGFPVSARTLAIGEWWNHYDLDGYIVKTFTEDVDDRQFILLGGKDIEQIITVIEENKLPHRSLVPSAPRKASLRKKDVATFKKALKWMQVNPLQEEEDRDVYYRSS